MHFYTFRAKIIFTPPPGGLLRRKNSGYKSPAPESTAYLLRVSRGSQTCHSLRVFGLSFDDVFVDIDDFIDAFTSIFVPDSVSSGLLIVPTFGRCCRPISASGRRVGVLSPPHPVIRRGSFRCPAASGAVFCRCRRC